MRAASASLPESNGAKRRVESGLIILWCSIGLTACGAKPPSVNDVKMEVYADVMCACDTPACADAIVKSYRKWMDAPPPKGKLSARDQSRFMGCASEAREARKPPDTKPPAPRPDTKPLPPKPPGVEPSTPDKARLLAKMRLFTDQVCACTDAACAKRAYEAMTTWATANRPALRRLMTDRQAQALQRKYETCYTRWASADDKGP